MPKPIDPLDETSKKIIEILQIDGRISYSDLAERVGLSPNAARQRVQKLQYEGVIQVVGVTDPIQVGFKRQALIGLKVSGHTQEIAKKLTELAEAAYVVLAAGSFDILVELVVEDDEALLRILDEKIRPIPGVSATETFVYLKLEKQRYDWGTR